MTAILQQAVHWQLRSAGSGGGGFSRRKEIFRDNFWGRPGRLFGAILRVMVIFHRRNAREHCLGYPDPRAGVQISMCSGYDLRHTG